MHTTRIGDYSFNHDGDPQGGEVSILKRNSDATDYLCRIPFNVIAEFVGQQVLSNKIAALEQQTGCEVLGFENVK